MNTDLTIDYYSRNVSAFGESTLNLDFSDNQDKFLTQVPSNGYILDFGCGSGRDSKYFIEKGYTVEATDGTPEMCILASKNVGITVKQLLFEELNETNKYDGIWACASILHLPSTELSDVLKKMCVALKPNGVIYTSFKYGTYEGERNGRYFTDFTKETFMDYMKNVPELQVIDFWITNDVRQGRSDEKWLNLFLRKTKKC